MNPLLLLWIAAAGSCLLLGQHDLQGRLGWYSNLCGAEQKVV